jgi:hypothetical protein
MTDADKRTGGAPKKDGWDKLTALSALLASVLVPLALGLIGQMYTASLQERERALAETQEKRQWVQIGIDILRDSAIDPKLREWAVELVNKNSGGNIRITDAVQRVLIEERVALPQQQSVAQEAAIVSDIGARGPRVDALQTRGLEALLERDLDSAIAAYDEAYRLWPVYRNIDELRKLLRGSRALPRQGDDQAWRALYRRIGAMDLRGVDTGVLDRLKAAANS